MISTLLLAFRHLLEQLSVALSHLAGRHFKNPF
jgi:hypothetical protein